MPAGTARVGGANRGGGYGGGGQGGAVSNGGTAGVSGAGIFEPVVDAAHNAAARFSTEAALNAVNVADTAGAAVDELGRAFGIVGNRAAEDIAWSPGSAEFFQTLGEHLTRVAAQMTEHGAQVRRADEEKIRRAEEKDPRERAWDIAANE
jgi:hypothetical protein